MSERASNGWERIVGYTLEAVIGASDAVVAGAVRCPDALVVPLRDNVSLVPMTDELFDAVTDRTSVRPYGFWKLPGGFDRMLASWSAVGPVGYVEAEYFGGVGSQRAVLWVAGELVLGPLHVDEGEPDPSGGSPVSQVLARLGIKRAGYRDEFEAVGLHQHRETEDWLPGSPPS
jgi:hypothetical protein